MIQFEVTLRREGLESVVIIEHDTMDAALRELRALVLDGEWQEVLNMISGRHTHFCERCQKDKECHQVSHCKRPAVWPCLDCRAEEFSKSESGFIEGRTEEHFYQTGKWPKE